MPATKVTLTGGAFQDSEGNVLANGYLEFVLNQDVSITGVGNIVAGITVTVKLDANGNVQAAPAQQVWGNDQMLPANSYYRVTGFTSTGQPAWGPNNQQVNGSGGSFNVGTWIPNRVISWTPAVTGTLLEIDGVANAVQTILNLISSAAVPTVLGGNIQFVDQGNGSVKAVGPGFKVNGTANADQSALNLVDGTGIHITNPSGNSATISATSGLPTGGTTGQVLTKNSATNYDASWGNAPVSLLPQPGMWLALNDSSASALSQDSTWISGVNLTNSISQFPGIVRSGSDTTYMQMSIASQSPGNGWNYSSKGTQGNQTSGPTWGTCKAYYCRAFPNANAYAAGSQPNFFFGVSRDIGDASGLRTGLATINGNGIQTDNGWRKNNSGIGYVGFVYQPVTSSNWLLVVGDGNGNATLVTSSIAVSTSLTQALQFTYDGSTVNFYINGALAGSINTTMPSNTMTMALFVGSCNIGASTPTGVAQTIGFSSSYLAYA